MQNTVASLFYLPRACKNLNNMWIPPKSMRGPAAWIDVGPHATCLPMIEATLLPSQETLCLPSILKEKSLWDSLTGSLANFTESLFLWIGCASSTSALLVHASICHRTRSTRRSSGYSTDFFDDKYHVAFGGSYATIPRLAGRRTVRNFYQHNYPSPWVRGPCMMRSGWVLERRRWDLDLC